MVTLYKSSALKYILDHFNHFSACKMQFITRRLSLTRTEADATWMPSSIIAAAAAAAINAIVSVGRTLID